MVSEGPSGPHRRPISAPSLSCLLSGGPVAHGSTTQEGVPGCSLASGGPPPNPGHQEPQSPCVALWVCLPPLPPTEKKQKSKLHYTWILSLKHDCWANGVLQSGAGSRLVQNKCRMNSKAVTREIMDHLTAPGKSKRSKTGWLRLGQGARGVRITESLRQARTSRSLGKGLHHSSPKAELRQKRLPGLQMHALPGQPLGNFRKSQ